MPIARLLRHVLVAIVAAIALYLGVRLAQYQLNKTDEVQEVAHVQKSLLTLPLLTVENEYSTVVEQMSKVQPKYVLINLWATWCAPCREELPLFEAVHAHFAPEDLLVIGIADDDFDKVRGFVDSLGLSFTQLVNDGTILDLPTYFGTISAVPLTVILDEEGNLLGHHFGAFHGNELVSFIEQYATDL